MVGRKVFIVTDEQRQRYSRNILLADIGGEGQEKLLKARVLSIGAGGLGSAAIYYLAAAGVGTIGIADSDRVDLTNLQRQILFVSADVGSSKTESAEEKINRLNPDVTVIKHMCRVAVDNITGIIVGYDFIIDATDNFDTKFLINDACVKAGIPFSHAGVLSFAGQAMTYIPGSACLRCFMPEIPPLGSYETPDRSGILGAVAGHLGTLQAVETVKYIAGAGKLLTDRMLFIDCLNARHTTIEIRKNSCSVCGGKEE